MTRARENQPSTARVAAVSSRDPLPVLSAKQNPGRVGPLESHRRRPQWESQAARAWRVFITAVGRDRHWLTELGHWRWQAVRQSRRPLMFGMTTAGLTAASHEDVDALHAFLSEDEPSRISEACVPPSDPLAAFSPEQDGARSHSRRRQSLIPFGCGVAVGALVTLLLSMPSFRGATTPALAHLDVAAGGSGSGQSLDDVVTSRGTIGSPVATTGERESNQLAGISAIGTSLPSPRITLPERRAAAPTRTQYQGSLAVNSAPAGARVLMNGVPVGTTPLLLKNIPVGSRVVRLELDGYERWSSAVRVVANQRVRAGADLRRLASNN